MENDDFQKHCSGPTMCTLVSQAVSGSFPVHFERVGGVKQCFSRKNLMCKRSCFASGESWSEKVTGFGSLDRTQVV